VVPNFLLGRYESLKYVLAGVEKTGIPLVQFDGTQFIPTAFSDDIGIYILFPKLMSIFGLSLDQTIIYFNMTLSLTAAALALVGFWKVYSSWSTRLISIAGVLFATKVTLMTEDVYRAPAALTIAALPWAIYFFHEQKGSAWARNLFLVLLGFGIGGTHYIRSFGGIPILLFTGVLIVTAWHTKWAHKFGALCLIGLGALVPCLYFYNCLAQYHQFVQKTFPQYAWVQLGHPFWHTVYGGLGFIQNEFGLKQDDAVSLNLVRSIAPDVFEANGFDKSSIPYLRYDHRYETILRNAYFKFIISYPHYVLENYFAKAGVICVYILRYVNVGLVALFLTGLPLNLLIALLAAGSWAVLPGIIAIPSVAAYILTFIVLCILFATLSINYFVANNGFQTLKPHIQRAKRSLGIAT
jgi:hypothetical protein